MKGLDNLPPELKALLPPVDLSVTQHKENFFASMDRHLHGADQQKMERMYETQTLWDEYMSESAVNYLKKFPSSTLVLIAGDISFLK